MYKNKVDQTKLLVVILNFHQHQHLIKLLDDLEKIKDGFYLHYYIGDILPSDKERGMIEKKICTDRFRGKTEYIVINENCGYAKGNNLLIKRAFIKDNYDYLLISNPDIRIRDKKVLEILVHQMEIDEKIGIIGPRVINFKRQQGPYLKPNPWLYGTKYLLPFIWFPFWLLREIYIKSLLGSKNVWRVIGSFMLIRAKPFIKVNGFDEGTFLYCEEDLLSFKFKKEGFNTYYCSKAIVHHLNEGRRHYYESLNSLEYCLKKLGYSSMSVKFATSAYHVYNSFWRNMILKELKCSRKSGEGNKEQNFVP